MNDTGIQHSQDKNQNNRQSSQPVDYAEEKRIIPSCFLTLFARLSMRSDNPYVYKDKNYNTRLVMTKCLKLGRSLCEIKEKIFQFSLKTEKTFNRRIGTMRIIRAHRKPRERCKKTGGDNSLLFCVSLQLARLG